MKQQGTIFCNITKFINSLQMIEIPEGCISLNFIKKKYSFFNIEMIILFIYIAQALTDKTTCL